MKICNTKKKEEKYKEKKRDFLKMSALESDCIIFDIKETTESHIFFLVGLNFNKQEYFKQIYVVPDCISKERILNHVHAQLNAPYNLIQRLNVLNLKSKITDNYKLTITFNDELILKLDVKIFVSNFCKNQEHLSANNIFCMLLYCVNLLQLPIHFVSSGTISNLLLKIIDTSKVVNLNFNSKKIVGGLHLEENQGRHTNILVVDFDSMYPSILINEDLLPSGYDSFQDNLTFLLAEKRKHTDYRRNICKILINSMYGLTGLKGCKLYNPDIMYNVCMSGRKKLLRLTQILKSFTILYGCTDSVFVKLNNSYDEQKILKIISSDSILKKYKFNFEHFKCIHIVSKNHYIAVDKKNRLIHCGSMVKRKAFLNLEKEIFSQIILKILCKDEFENILKDICEIQYLLVNKYSISNVEELEKIKKKLYKEIFKYCDGDQKELEYMF